MPHAAVSYTFPKKRRLKSSLRIRDIVARRETVSKYPIKCFYVIDRDCSEDDMRVAMLVSKKKLRCAVDRNRTKRVLRESFRINCNSLAIPNNFRIDICWMFTGQELPEHASVMQAGKFIFESLQTIIDQYANIEEND